MTALSSLGLVSVSPLGPPTAARTSGSADSSAPVTTGSPVNTTLSPEIVNAILQLSAIDRRVHAHEQAHLAAAGPYAKGGPSYGYTVGPDGKLYATSGEVSLDVAPDPSSPEATVQKARTIEAAASAPLDPSSQDRMVAAEAVEMEQSAERELALKAKRAYAAGGSDGTPALGQMFSWMA